MTHPLDDVDGSQAPVAVTVDSQGGLLIADVVDGEAVPRADTVWPAAYGLVRVGGRRVPVCRTCGEVAPADLETHPDTHAGVM